MRKFRQLLTIVSLTVLWGCLQPVAPALAEINIEASLNPSRTSVGEPVELTISITGAGGGIQAPKLPELKGFQSYSQGHSEEFSFVNGKSSSRTVFSFVLVPTEEGVFTIDSLVIPIEGKNFKTGALKIEVGPQSAARARPTPAGKPVAQVVPPSSRSLPPDYMASQEIFVRAWTDREEAYVNQPIYLTYTLYTRTSATFKGFEDEPETAGYWVEDFAPNPQINRQERVLGGYRYVIADVRQVALFPTEPGVKRFEPGSLKVDVETIRGQPGSVGFQNPFFRQRFSPSNFVTEIQPRILETEPINFKIKPLPEAGKPEGYGGAVGHFKVEASADQTQVEEGHPVTFKIKVTGEGNLNTLTMPLPPKIEGFKSYDSSSGLNLRKDRMIVEGEKTLDTVYVPRKAGVYTLPAVTFSYFDPAKESYVTLNTQPIQLQVTPAPPGEAPEPEPAPVSAPAPAADSGKPAPQGLEGIRFIKTSQGFQARVLPPAMTQPSFWLVQASALVTACILLLLRLIFERLGVNLLGAKPRRFKGEAFKSLRKAKRLMRTGSEKEFFEALSRAVQGYFADKLRVEIGGVSIARVEIAMKDRVSDAEDAEIKNLFYRIDYGRFSTARMTQDEMKRLYDDAERVLALVEKKKL